MKKWGVLLVSILFFISIVSAEASYIFKQDVPTDLKISCFDESEALCSSGTQCFLTIQYPYGKDLIKNQSLIYNYDYYVIHNITFNISGTYYAVARCSNNSFSTYTIEVNPAGKAQTSILNNPLIIIFTLIGLALVGFGAWMGIPWFGFIGAVMFLMSGVYTMIYGFNDVVDLYTRTIGITYIGLGFIFIFTAAYEWTRSD